jgi:hypothetical protein
VAPLDSALRRRFAFHRIEPQMPTHDLLPATIPAPVRELFNTSAGILRDLNDHVLRPCLGPDAMLGHSYLYAAASTLKDTPRVDHAVTHIKMQWQYTILPQLIDSIRALNAENLLSPDTRSDWFAGHTELDADVPTATAALTQLDDFLHTSLELQVIVEGTGLARGARIAAHRKPTAEDAASPTPADEPGSPEAAGGTEPA